MRITSMLSWWDEPPEELAACVESMAALCDRVVAFDGAYKWTPGATAASSPEQVAAIYSAAERAGLDAEVYVPDVVWDGQVQKRDEMLRTAAEDSDWVIALDADHRLVGDREAVRAELAATDADSIFYDFHTPIPEGTNLEEVKRISPHLWHTGLAGKTMKHSLLLRALDDMRLEFVHYGYSGVNKDLGRVVLGYWTSRSAARWGAKYADSKRHQLRSRFRTDHVCFSRDLARLERNKEYAVMRDKFRESHGYEP